MAMSYVHSCSSYSFGSHLPSVTRKPQQILFPLLHLSTTYLNPFLSFHPPTLTTRKRRTLLQASQENQTPSSFSYHGVVAGDDELSPRSSSSLISASDVVRNFYDGINRHDLVSVEGLIAQNCIYEDLIFPRPFLGRKAIIEFFGKFIDYLSTDLQFVIDAISEEDSSAVGVTWHLEWKGRPFPFSKGCSFYRLEVVNGIRQIIYARDSVEPAIKPGESALIIIRGVTWLLQRFPKLVDWL